MTPRRCLTLLTGGAALGAALAAPGQFLPPFNVLSHEFTQVFTLISALLVLFVARGLAAVAVPARGASEPTRRSALRLQLASLALGMAAGAWGFVALASYSRCTPMAGTAFFWVTWAPLTMLAGAVGLTLGARGWRRRGVLALLAAAVTVDLLHLALQGFVGARIVDLFIGEPLALDQRADLAVSATHLGQRAWVAGLALLVATADDLGATRACRELPAAERSHRLGLGRVKALILGLALALTAIAWGDRVGLGFGRGALYGHLSEEHRTANYILRHPPGGDAAFKVEAVGRVLEWEWYLVTGVLDIERRRPVTVHVFDTQDDMRDFTGIRASHAANGEIFTHARVRRSTLRHELVHAVHEDFGSWLTALAWRGVAEGLAVAIERDLYLHPQAHRRHAAAARAGTLPSASRFMSLPGFWTTQESNAYSAAGSFVGWLIMTRGADPLRNLGLPPRWERAAGASLATLDGEWRRFLLDLPGDTETEAALADSFDADLMPGYSAGRCPKVGERAPRLLDQAGRRARLGDWRGALELYGELAGEAPSPRLAWQQARLWWDNGHPRRAMEVTEAALALGDLSAAEQDRLLTIQVNAALAARDWASFQRAWEARQGLPGADTARRRHTGSLLAREDIREDLAAALSATDRCETRMKVLSLLERHPDEPELRHVALAFGFPPSSRPTGSLYAAREWLDGLVEAAGDEPATLAPLAQALLDLADDAMADGDHDLAAAAACLVVTIPPTEDDGPPPTLLDLQAERRLAILAAEVGSEASECPDQWRGSP